MGKGAGVFWGAYRGEGGGVVGESCWRARSVFGYTEGSGNGVGAGEYDIFGDEEAYADDCGTVSSEEACNGYLIPAQSAI